MIVPADDCARLLLPDARPMAREFTCSSYTVSGMMPGGQSASRHPLDERLRACAAAGYTGYWLHWRDYLEQREAGLDDSTIRALFDEHGMRHRGVEFFSDWFRSDAHGEAEEASFAAAGAIGATVVNVGGNFTGPELSRAEMVTRFEDLCRRAGGAGLAVALEYVPWSDIPDLAAALEFMEPDNAGLVVDSWHTFRGGVKLAEIAALPPAKLLCVQVNDATAEPAAPLPQDTARRLPCGDGAFDLAGFAAALDVAGVDVPWAVEIISPEFVGMPVEEAARRSFEAASRTFAAARRASPS